MDITSLIRWMDSITEEAKKWSRAMFKEVSLKKGYLPPSPPKKPQTNKNEELLGKTVKKKLMPSRL